MEKLRTYRDEVEAEVKRILSFWVAQTPDETNGGFIGRIDNHGNVDPAAPKGSVLNARILWSFSAAYRHTGEQEHRQMADRACSYFLQHFWDETHGGVYWSVDAQGQPFQTRKQIYALAFGIYGLSEYFLATGETKALEAAKSLFAWIEQYSFDEKRGGYLEAFSREGELLLDLRLSEKDRNDPKTMNTHLHVLEAYANLYRIWPDALLGQQLKGLLQVFLTHIVDRETGHLKLFFTEDWTPTADLVSFGHDIEAAWLLQEAAEVLGDEGLLGEAKALAVKMAQATAEGLQPDGSLFHEMNRAENHYDKHREWWVSAEAMVGFLNAYALTGEAHFFQQSWASWEFAKKHFLDRERGEWFWGVHDDYSLMAAEDKAGFWKCPYHNTRACLEVVQRIKKLL